MKVKIRDTVGNYQRPDKMWEVYYPGDIIEVEEEDFYPDIMEKIEEAKTEEPKVVGVDLTSQTETEVTITAEEPVSEEPKATRKRRKI